MNEHENNDQPEYAYDNSLSPVFAPGIENHDEYKKSQQYFATVPDLAEVESEDEATTNTPH